MGKRIDENDRALQRFIDMAIDGKDPHANKDHHAARRLAIELARSAAELDDLAIKGLCLFAQMAQQDCERASRLLGLV